MILPLFLFYSITYPTLRTVLICLLLSPSFLRRVLICISTVRDSPSNSVSHTRSIIISLDKTIPAFEMYTEVIQNSVIGLIREGRIKFGSACSLTVTNDCLEGIYNDMDFFRDKLVLRPSEISNNPEVVRRLGVISINTAIEVDLYGNVNSTHIGGTKMMNGIGRPLSKTVHIPTTNSYFGITSNWPAARHRLRTLFRLHWACTQNLPRAVI